MDALRTEQDTVDDKLVKLVTGSVKGRKPKSVELDERLRVIAESYEKNDYLSYLRRISLVLV